MNKNQSILLICVFLALSPAYAGTFDHGSFGNEAALDWVGNELKQLGGQRAVERAISIVNKTSGYLEAPQCCNAIAACEVLAAALGRPAKVLPREVTEEAKRLSPKVSDVLRKDARAALEKIMTKSELQELWAESPKFQDWIKAVTELKARL